MLRHLNRGKLFYRRVFYLALPLILQNLVTTSLGFVDTFMVGLLGNEEMAAVTAANAPIFLVQVIIFGVMSGLTVLVSQYWGKGDTGSINRCMGVAMYVGVGVAAAVAATLFLAPARVLSLVTDNLRLIELGAPYIRIVGLSYVFNAASSVYVAMQRSTENPALGMKVFCTSMLVNTGLNYVLIFGKLGCPALGITGAALATLTSRIVEFTIVAVYGVRDRRVPLEPGKLLRPGTAIARDFVRYATPVVGNETLWGLGTTVLTAIMGHMDESTAFLAAHALMGNVDKFATVACFGLAGAAAVLVGKGIGEGDSREETYSLSLCLLLLSLGVGVLISLALAALLPTFFRPVLFPLFKLSPAATRIATSMCLVYLVYMPMRAFDITNITGVLRAGGDALMAAAIDLGPLWLLAIPLTAALGLWLRAPAAVVCFALQAENLAKMPLGIVRLRSRKWIHQVTREETA